MNWERFEEQTKLAFVGDQLNARFFLKTRVTDTKSVKVVVRVSRCSAKPAGGRKETVKYTTSDTTNLSRLMRLLHFVMKEVLGPMKTLQTSTTTGSKPSNTPTPATQADKKKRKNKLKTKSTKSLG